MATPVALPESSSTQRCSDFARLARLHPAGTSISAERIIVAEVALPWPKPVFDHPALTGVKAAADASQPSTRVLAAVPRKSTSGSNQPGQQREVVQYLRRADGGVDRDSWWVPPAETAQAILNVLAGDTSGLERSTVASPTAEVWICTQGSHDVCCGTDGTRLANEIEGRWNDVTIRRVSHTGGHRFAPTAMTMPDGRMWAYLDVEALETVLRRGSDHSRIADRCRGWWGADTGPAQVAECGVFGLTGWTWETAPRRATVIDHDDTTNITTVEVVAGSTQARDVGVASWLVRVGISRDVPSIACRAPGGLPAKPGFEYEVLSITLGQH